jgi:hypothetical protein
LFSTNTLSEDEMHKIEKDIKDQENKINDLKLKFLLSKVQAAIFKHTEDVWMPLLIL